MMQSAKRSILLVADVRAAHSTIQPLINRTPTLQSESISRAASSPDLNIRFHLKCENLQKSGSFKFRGATNFIAQQTDEALRKGLVAISTGNSLVIPIVYLRLTMLPTGNFGHAVALAAKTAARSRRLRIKTSIVLPATSDPSKISRAQANGATVVLAGTEPHHREAVARKILKETGATLVGPMDDPEIVLGQATATLEFVDQVGKDGIRLDALMLPSATGGILSGAALACQGSNTLIFGCEPSEGGPELRTGVLSGILPTPKHMSSIADGLRASASKGNFDFICEHVHGIYAVTDSEIRQAWRLLLQETGLMLEPSSAVSVATVIFNRGFRQRLAASKRDWDIGVILTGGNTTVARIIQEFSGLQESSQGERLHIEAAIA
jgi:threonine dehydratase